MSLSLNLPVNSVSFGQTSTLFLRELIKKNKNFLLFPIGNNIDLGSQTDFSQDNVAILQKALSESLSEHKRSNKIFKLWHLNGSLESFSEKQVLFSFYELDSPTKFEVNIVKNQEKVLFSSNYAVDLFKSHGCKNVEFVPLCFDKYNFSRKDKKYFSDDRIVFNLVGKLEKRKHHKKLIQTWLRKYGNNKKYYLQCAINNPFIPPEQHQPLIASILEGKNYFNISFIGGMPLNSSYNDYLNSGDIVIGMSGGEGWGLPEFHSVALGKHAVILNAHSYKDWANENNAILVEPNGKIEAYDNMFFHKGAPFNQGNIFDFHEDDFISGCEKAIEKVSSNRLNQEGLKLQDKFNSESFTDKILSYIE
jgi:hypothetical protein